MNRAKQQVDESRKMYSSLSQAMQKLEERTGEADIIGRAQRKGELGMVSGRKLVRRYVAISKTGSLFVFQDNKGGKPQAEMKLDSTTKLAMLDKIKCGFQIQSGMETMIFSANDDMDMVQWTNTILKLQVSGISDYADQTSDAFSQTAHSLDQITMYINRITANADELNDQAALLARIAALENQVRQKDHEITTLKQLHQ